jgi:hypothetical protein
VKTIKEGMIEGEEEKYEEIDMRNEESEDEEEKYEMVNIE